MAANVKEGWQNVPPVPQLATAVASAMVVVDSKSYLFYYDSNDSLLHVAIGQENKNFPSGAITDKDSGDNIPIPRVNTPSPLAAGYDPDKKEIHVFYVDSQTGYICEVISADHAQTWSFGNLKSYKIGMAGPYAALTVYPGNIWRIMCRPTNLPANTFALIYETQPNQWATWNLP